MNIIAARRYVSPRSRALTVEEAETRRLAYAIKEAGCPDGDLRQAARDMAACIWGNCVLVPVPNSQGDTAANRRLANAIAAELGGATRVMDCLTRQHPIESQRERHRRKLGPIRAEAHGITRRRGVFFRVGVPVYCVDNVTTSGNTLAACRLAISIARGLVFADAYLTDWKGGVE